MLVFYPFAFSPVCTDQLNLYEEVLDDSAQGATLYGVSCDATGRRPRFAEKLGVSIEQLSDFEPKGAVCRAFGVYHPGGFPQRALVIVGPDGVVQVELSGRLAGRSAGRQPDLRRAGALSRRAAPLAPPRRRRHGADASSVAPVPGARRRDYVRGPARHAADHRLRGLRVPVLRGAPSCACERWRWPSSSATSRCAPAIPRAWAAACAAEAAGRQGRFWEMHDALFGDQGRIEDPHLWARARALGLDLGRFDTDRRDPAVAERVERDFRSGVRAGVVTTPALFEWRDGVAIRVDAPELEARSQGS